jgi:hypothetical protein
MAAGGLLAFAIWTLPNWSEFWSHVWQFPILWQIPTNRRIIISLSIKEASPLLIMGIIEIIVWLSSLLKPSQPEALTQPVRREQGLHEHSIGRIPHGASASMPGQTLKTRDASISLHPLAPPASRRDHPETPLPPTPSCSETLGQEADGSQNSVTHPTDGQAAPLTGQKSEPGAQGGASTASPTLLTFDVSQPVASTRELVASTEPLISLRLLKDVSVVINVPGGGHAVVPLTPNAKRVQLLAYIAWRRGELIDRDKILEHVFGWGLSDEEATEDKLSERFESHKKLLRKKIREVVIEQVNKPAGREVIDPELDPFVSDAGFWGLAEICRVEDLEAIESSYRVIALARKDGKLVDEIPEYVKEACERLIASYAGDFLETLLKKYPGEFRSWEGRSSWARKPFTLFRDRYLDALWSSAEYEWSLGQRSAEEQASEAGQRKVQEHYGRAAELYETYAMYACNNRFDAKATFGAHGEYGERIGMSERALRRCVVLQGAIGRTDLVNQVWSTYSAQMKSISDHRWQPSQETQADVQAAKAQTKAYRFAAQVSQMSSAFANRQDRLS